MYMYFADICVGSVTA